MVDIERAGGSVPIIANPTGKLRNLAGGVQPFAESDGLIDAFAEVFAQMSVATAAPVEQPAEVGETNSVDRPAQEDEESQQASVLESGQAERQNYQPHDQPTAVESLAPEPKLATQKHAKADSDPTETRDNRIVVDQPKAKIDEQTTSQVTEAELIESSEAVAPVVADTNQTVEATAVAAASESPTRRGRSDSTAARVPEAKLESIENSADPTIEPSTPSEAEPAIEPTVGESQQRSSDQPSEKTARQQFLDQRRTDRQPSGHADRQGSDRDVTQAPETNITRSTNAAETVSQIDNAAAPKLNPSSANPSTVLATASTTHPAAAATNGTSGVGRGGQGEARPGVANGLSGGAERRIDTATGRETRPTKNSATDTTTRIKLVQRVSRAFQHLGPEGGIVRLKLAPAELGSVRVEMQVKQRKVQARVVAETEGAEAALREHLPDLRARLESLGMQVERLEIETESNDTDNRSQFHEQTQERGPRERESDRRRETNRDRPTDSRSAGENDESTAMNLAIATGGVDLRL